MIVHGNDKELQETTDTAKMVNDLFSEKNVSLKNGINALLRLLCISAHVCGKVDASEICEMVTGCCAELDKSGEVGQAAAVIDGVKEVGQAAAVIDGLPEGAVVGKMGGSVN